MVQRIWDNDLTRTERETLLHAVYPNRSKGLIDLEARLTWRKLLPSTQLILRDVDWCAILDRDVRPD